MKISDRRLKISDSLKISDFSNSLGVLHKHPQQYAYAPRDYLCKILRGSQQLANVPNGVETLPKISIT